MRLAKRSLSESNLSLANMDSRFHRFYKLNEKTISTVDVALLTVVTLNHLHFALALLASLRKHHPDKNLFVCLVDRPTSLPDIVDRGIQFVFPEQFEIPRWDRFAFQYSAFELACALKPYAFEYIAKLGFRKLVYLDADIQVYAPLDEISELLNYNDILLTPHLTSELPDNVCEPTLAGLRTTGVYNAGFIALRTTETGMRFLKWWKERCQKTCIVDITGGVHVDQAWLDFVPGMFSGVSIIRRHGWNVAYWNLPNRPIRIDQNGHYWVHDERLLFFHFSGYDPSLPHVLSKHQNQIRLEKLPIVQNLIASFAQLLDAVGRHEYESLGYGFANLSDGTNIHPRWREVIRCESAGFPGIGNPFETSANTGQKRRLMKASIELVDARSDWHQRTAIAAGRILNATPGLGWLYRFARTLLEK